MNAITQKVLAIAVEDRKINLNQLLDTLLVAYSPRLHGIYDDIEKIVNEIRDINEDLVKGDDHG